MMMTGNTHREDGHMQLTDAEREEFLALTQETYDPELWTEDDLPALRAARQEFEEAQQRDVHHARDAGRQRPPAPILQIVRRKMVRIAFWACLPPHRGDASDRLPPNDSRELCHRPRQQPLSIQLIA
jgi:hypothetical protein